MHTRPTHHRSDLVRITIHAMTERGLLPEFSPRVERELATISGPSMETGPEIRDLSALLWCSIDNDDSLDLDQLTACEVLPAGTVRLWVAIADVDALVPLDSAIDRHASTNTRTLYTSARIFPMLPERLSNDLTSLNEHAERLAIVTEMVFNTDASLAGFTLYRARVRNRAKLAYDAVSAWFEEQGDLPEAAQRVPGMQAQLRTQDRLAQQLSARRREEGSLEFDFFEPRVVFDGERVADIRLQEHNRARQLIEEVMIVTNTCTARYLGAHGGASLRRVVRSPERWRRIVAVAKAYGEHLPAEPDSVALGGFLAKRRRADPLRFPDLSLVIVKLMGRGEYVLEAPGGAPIGHFGLALSDYTHSTAPNRRYPDLITARLLKAVMAQQPAPYSNAELGALALHCTRQEDAVQKVERRMRKSEAALLLESRIGQRFEAIVTGNVADGVWVRLLAPPAEGKLISATQVLKVGDKVRVKLVATSVEHGFLDFEQVQ